jgi:hypothetical protein
VTLAVYVSNEPAAASPEAVSETALPEEEPAQ